MAKIDKLNKKLYIHIFKLKQGDLWSFTKKQKFGLIYIKCVLCDSMTSNRNHWNKLMLEIFN